MKGTRRIPTGSLQIDRLALLSKLDLTKKYGVSVQMLFPIVQHETNSLLLFDETGTVCSCLMSLLRKKDHQSACSGLMIFLSPVSFGLFCTTRIDNSFVQQMLMICGN
ncbi:hypothetical protein PAHAL_4G047100 [Panicum hallii]|uniref:Uncharacterized protein n=1 Tax=Panicum hallii TaxID=206008 RepID=A0A2T8JBS1_9POAL|nr:hypothetical protein PAHAL_4G047100 [Panicum hallii]